MYYPKNLSKVTHAYFLGLNKLNVHWKSNTYCSLKVFYYSLWLTNVCPRQLDFNNCGTIWLDFLKFRLSFILIVFLLWFEFQVNYNGVAIQGSPFRTTKNNISQTTDNQKPAVRVFGPGLEKPVFEKKDLVFTVDCREADPG